MPNLRLLLMALALPLLADCQDRFAEIITLQSTVELDNPQLHVVRNRIASLVTLRAGFTTSAKGSLLVAVTPVDLRFTGGDGKTFEVHLAAGLTSWIAAAAVGVRNLGEECEFLLIEAKR